MLEITPNERYRVAYLDAADHSQEFIAEFLDIKRLTRCLTGHLLFANRISSGRDRSGNSVFEGFVFTGPFPP